ncbi:MAG: peptidoglycan-binding protein [Deltaproteobacteria bacterium]|nr:peptidoglycan-binding protein [Deltaproteobacteria bacterium]
MGKYHTVVQGEHLSSLAKKYGFSDYQTIWNDGQNAEVKKKRKNPNVLFPGDRLFIPDKHEKQEARNTEKLHRFVLQQPPLKLQLLVEDLYEKPVAGAAYELELEGESRPRTQNTGGDGKIEEAIPPTVERGVLVIKDPETPLNEIRLAVKIGHLDPVEEISGQKGRLNNLGYYAGPIAEDEDELWFRSAVEEFQCDYQLTVDGICGPQTQAKLREVHDGE